MPNFAFSVIVTTDTYEHAVRVMQEHIGQFGGQEPLFASGVEIDYQIEIDWNHPTGTTVEAPLLEAATRPMRST
jgi:hypothetical protein